MRSADVLEELGAAGQAGRVELRALQTTLRSTPCSTSTPTADDATQTSIIKQLAAFWIKDVPMIPTTESVDWFPVQHRRHPRLADRRPTPYAEPSAYRAIDAEQVILHLYSQARNRSRKQRTTMGKPPMRYVLRRLGLLRAHLVGGPHP